MSIGKVKNRIKERAKETGIHFNQMLTIVAYERAVARLAADSKLRDTVIFKGGMVMRAAYGSERYTGDLDASFEGISYDDLKVSIEKSLKTKLDDGFEFHSGKWGPIAEEKVYSGIRFETEFSFGGAKIQSLQFDFTLSEISKSFVKKQVELGLDESKEMIQIYPPEMIIAEKLQTLVSRGEANTRAKDIYDINFLLSKGVNKKELNDYVKRVFKARKTSVPSSFKRVLKECKSQSLMDSWNRYKRTLSGAEFDEMWKSLEENLGELDSYFHRGLSR